MRTILKLIIFISIIVSLNGCNNKPHFTIYGQIGGNDNEKVFLAKYVNGDFLLTDSAVVNKGKFRFDGKQSTPEYFYILNGKKTQFVQFFLENAEITVTGHLDSISFAKVSGSPSQDEYMNFNDGLDKIAVGFRPFQSALDSARKYNNNELIEINKKNIDSVRAVFNKFISDHITGHPASPVTIEIIMDNRFSLKPEEIESWLGKLDPSMKNSDRVVTLYNILDIMKKVAIGQTAQDFIQKDSTGTPVKLSSFYGKYLLLDFWASWCFPCREENTNLVAMYKRFHEKGFDIISVSLDENREEWLGAIKQDNLMWTQISDLKGGKNEAAELYGVDLIPDNFLLDKDGKILARRLRGESLTVKLEELLGR
jgi:peroxiredoxin